MMQSLHLVTFLLVAVVISQSFADKSNYSSKNNAVEKKKSKAAPPMVAFVCKKPAMYLTEKGWVRDETTDCLKDPVQILNYCKEVYPDMDITNVVEASETVEIDGWCKRGHDHCKHFGKHTVRPFRCLVGPFQSDALLVPEHCLFDHVHNSDCKSYSEWNTTAYESCWARGMGMQSFAILLPCGIDRFSGVEFVCCPEEDEDDYYDYDDTEEDEEDEDEDDYSDEGDYSDEEDSEDEDDYKTDIKQKPKDKDNFAFDEKPPAVIKKPKIIKQKVKPVVDAYTQYLQKQSNFLNEHQYFMKAKQDLQKRHHEKVTKMMKEWAVARQRVMEMRAEDQKAAEKLNKEITLRFQKTYQALEQEGMAEKNQLTTLHQQRVQVHLNDKKRKAMEHYMQILQKTDPRPETILTALKHYLKIEEKDKMHAVNHFKHLQDANPDEAERVAQQTLDHLKIIDQRIAQAVDMLSRQPQYQDKIRQGAMEFMKSFQEIDDNIRRMLTKPAKNEEPTDGAILKKYKEAEKQNAIPEKPTEGDKPEEPTEAEVSNESELHHVPLNKDPMLKPTGLDKAEDEEEKEETHEDEHAYVEAKPAAHQELNNFAAEENAYISQERVSDKAVFHSSTLGIAVGSIAVFVVIVVGIVVLRKRAQRVPVSHGFVEVDPAASPEERHVANMQMNGYENPTYKYFEGNA